MTVAVAEVLLKAETDAEVPALRQLRKRFRQEGVGGGMALRFHGADQRGGQGHGGCDLRPGHAGGGGLVRPCTAAPVWLKHVVIKLHF